MEDSRPMQARVSNHGTWLRTWYDKDYDPSYAINTCVVFSENGKDKSDVSVDMEIKGKSLYRYFLSQANINGYTT